MRVLHKGAGGLTLQDRCSLCHSRPECPIADTIQYTIAFAFLAQSRFTVNATCRMGRSIGSHSRFGCVAYGLFGGSAQPPLGCQSNWEAVCGSCLEILKKSPDEGGVDFRSLKKQKQCSDGAGASAPETAGSASDEAKPDPLKLSKV